MIPDIPEIPEIPKPDAESRERLERMVAARKNREASRTETSQPKPAEPEPINPDDFRLFAESGGIRILPDAEIQAMRDRDAAQRRLGFWNEAVPATYSEPFDFAKAKGNHDEIRRALAWQYGDRGLYIIGKTGSSKSRAVANALKPYFMAGGSVRYLSGVEFSEQCSAITMEGKGLAKWKADLCRVGVLWIDDLGKRWTRATEEECFSIVEDRTSRGRPIIITTNYDRDQMLAKAHDAETMGPLLRRFRDYMETLDFDK